MRPIPGGTAKGKESRSGKEKSRDLHGAETNDRSRRQKTSCTTLHHTAQAHTGTPETVTHRIARVFIVSTFILVNPDA